MGLWLFRNGDISGALGRSSNVILAAANHP